MRNRSKNALCQLYRRIYEGKSHKRKRFSLILQSIFFFLPLPRSFVVWCAIFAVKFFFGVASAVGEPPIKRTPHTLFLISTQKHRWNIINQLLYLERHSFYLRFPCAQRKNSKHFCNYDSA